MPGTKYFCLVAHNVAVLSQAWAALQFRRHGVFAICFLTVFVSMVHRRSALGAWNHAQRSYERGYLPSPPPPYFPGDELIDDVLLPPPPPPVFLGVESPPVFQGVECVLADSVVQDKDTSLPTIISLAEHLPNTTKSAPIGPNEFGFELRRRIRDWTPTDTGSFGIPLRRLVRGPNVENRGAIDILDNTGPATYEAFYIGDEGALVIDEEAFEDGFCPNSVLVAEPGHSKANV